jgi:hypothetical protein
MHPTLKKLIKITPLAVGPLNYLTSQIILTFIIEKTKIPPSLSQVLTTHHPNAFTLILSLLEGRAGITWVPSNNLSPPEIKRLLLLSTIFSLFLLYFLTLSLPLRRVKRRGKKSFKFIRNNV